MKVFRDTTTTRRDVLALPTLQSFREKNGNEWIIELLLKNKKEKIVFQHTMPLTDFPVHRRQRKRMLFVSAFILLLRPPAIRRRNFMDKHHGSRATARASVHVKTGYTKKGLLPLFNQGLVMPLIYPQSRAAIL
jgi:hypothetical protein